MSAVYYPEQVDGSKFILSPSSYNYGPNAKILYCDYLQPRNSCDILFHAAETPFGLSSFQGDVSKTSIQVRVPSGSPLLSSFATLEENFKKLLVKTPANLPVPMTIETINRLWIPSISNDMFGHSIRFSVKTNVDGVLRALFLKRSFKEDGVNTQTENLTGLPVSELQSIFGPKSIVWVLARVSGVAVSKTSIQIKFSLVQLIKDETIFHEVALRDDSNYTTPLDEKYFLGQRKEEEEEEEE
jgi:hypothetical protein